MKLRRDITLDELPKYSHWVNYLLGLKNIGRTLNKDTENISREFGTEKWGSLYLHLKNLVKPEISNADSFFIKDIEQAYYSNNKISVTASNDAHELYFNFILNSLKSHLAGCSQIVELGAGYGHILLNLIQKDGFEKVTFLGGEYTQSGVDCMKLLSSRNSNVIAGLCDLNELNLNTLTPNNGAVFFTSWTMAYVKGFPRKTLLEILKYKPAVVIHFEPIIEHWDDNSLLNLLWKKYLLLNNYNSSLLTELKKYEEEGLIKIIEQQKNCFGLNPLAPVSVIKWIPCN